MYIDQKEKIIIFLAILFAVLLIVFSLLILGSVGEISKRNLLLYSLALMVLNVILGTVIIRNKELKKRGNYLIRIMVLISPCLLGISISLAILSYLYVHRNFDIMDSWVMISLICVPVSYIVGILWVIQRLKFRKKGNL